MENFKLTPIENEGKRVLTTAQLAESYGTGCKTITDNFNNNRKRYIEGKHFYCLTGNELRAFKSESENFGFAPNLNKLYLWTEKGALLHAKSLNTDKAWEVYDFLVENYFRVQQKKQLSPIEMIAGIANNAVAMERRLAEQEKAIANTNQRIDDMREVMKPVSDDWRPAMNKLVSRIAYTADYPIDELRVDIYDEVDIRGGVHLDTRLENLRNRMWERGTAWSTCERLNKLDVIQQDKKLIAIYVAVVRELAAKYIS